MINFFENHTLKMCVGLLIIVILFHIFVLLKIIPYTIVWGGRLQNDNEMYVFESISVAINLFLVWILLMKGNILKKIISIKIINIILYVFLVIFILNTLGNVFAKTNFEKIFSILTGALAIFMTIIIRKKDILL